MSDISDRFCFCLSAPCRIKGSFLLSVIYHFKVSFTDPGLQQIRHFSTLCRCGPSKRKPFQSTDIWLSSILQIFPFIIYCYCYCSFLLTAWRLFATAKKTRQQTTLLLTLQGDILSIHGVVVVSCCKPAEMTGVLLK